MQVFDIFDQLRTGHRIGQIEFGEQARDRRCCDTAPAAVFDIDRHGDFRIVARSETHESTVVRAMRILRGTGLAANVDSFDTGHAGRSPVHIHRPVHALDNRVEMFGIDLRIVFFIEPAVDRIPVVNALDHMGNFVISPVRDGSGEIGHLQRRATQLALPDRQRNNRQAVPTSTVSLVVKRRGRHIAVQLAGEVRTQFTPESETAHIIVPYIQTLLDVPVFAVLITCATASYCLRLPYSMMVLAAGHYKQTQNSAIIEMILNVVISIGLVFWFGLVGVAIGTMISMTYRTVYYALYLRKNILERRFIFFIKHILIDIGTVACMVGATFWIKLSAVNYFAWIIMALECGGICLAVSIIINLVFYRKTFINTIRLLFSRQKVDDKVEN